jgi:hypothetical protein
MGATNPIVAHTIDKLKGKIPDFEAELSRLRNTKKEELDDSDELIICFEMLLSEEIRTFDLLVPGAGLAFVMSMKTNVLSIEIRSTDERLLHTKTTSDGLAELAQLGFLIHAHSVVREINSFHKQMILPTIELLSRIAFDVFRLYGNKPARLILKT